MGAKNAVVEGDYKGKVVAFQFQQLFINLGIGKRLLIDSTTVDEYDVLDSEHKTSGTSAVSRAAVGTFFLGPAGLLLGATAKKKGVHLVAIQFKDGKKSLLEIDDKIYKAMIKALF